jgi:hypothetical protein
MTGRSSTEREVRQAFRKQSLKSEQRYSESVAGMQATAATLRRSASEMTDSNDCDRLANGYEHRADVVLRRPQRLIKAG